MAHVVELMAERFPMAVSGFSWCGWARWATFHALPAVSALRLGFPEAEICWAAAPRWRDLLHGNPLVDELIEIDRRRARWLKAWRVAA